MSQNGQNDVGIQCIEKWQPCGVGALPREKPPLSRGPLCTKDGL